jgi:arsenical pump membrane protein
VRDVLTYTAPALTVTLVLTRPRIGTRRRIGPALAALAGLLVMLAAGAVQPVELRDAARILWHPFIAVASIMLTAAVAERVGLLERIASLVEKRTRGPVWWAFFTVFALAAATATLFNNDSAILLLTPMIVALVRRRYPLRQYLVVPFSFAVFAAAGVAPFVISNPINVVVCSHAGIGFNEYARIMVPVALTGLLVAFLSLALVFRREIDDHIPGRGPEAEPLPPMSAAEWQALGVLALVFGAYPIVSYLDGPMWAVAVSGAALGMLLCHTQGIASPRQLTASVAWDILVFLFAVFVMAQGLKHVGAVGILTNLYAHVANVRAQIAAIGLISAGGSALLNNHPMAILNALAIQDLPGGDRRHILAALIGGDLGPRLLPIGSLAGLLWLKMLGRLSVTVPVRLFVRVGVIITVPALVASLLVLIALT